MLLCRSRRPRDSCRRKRHRPGTDATGTFFAWIPWPLLTLAPLACGVIGPGLATLYGERAGEMTVLLRDSRAEEFSFRTLSYAPGVAVQEDDKDEEVTEDREMPEPSARRKPASDFELKIAAGDEAAISQLVFELGPPLHNHLSLELPELLNRDDREDLMMAFIADIISKKIRYDSDKGTLISFAKVCVYRKAIDLLRKRGRAKQQDFGYGLKSLLRLQQESPLSDAEFAEAVERAKIAFETMPPNHRAAVEARHRHGRDGYKAVLVREYGITPGLAAQWLRRGLKALSEATGLAAEETK